MVASALPAPVRAIPVSDETGRLRAEVARLHTENATVRIANEALRDALMVAAGDLAHLRTLADVLRGAGSLDVASSLAAGLLDEIGSAHRFVLRAVEIGTAPPAERPRLGLVVTGEARP